MFAVMLSAMKNFVEIVKVPFRNVSFNRLMVALRFCETLHVVLMLLFMFMLSKGRSNSTSPTENPPKYWCPSSV